MQLSAENDQTVMLDQGVDALWSQANTDPDMAYVVASLQPMLDAGDATLQPIGGGVLELRLLSGETFHFGATGVTRVE